MENRVTKLWEMYQKGLNYQNNIDLIYKSNEAVDFLDGKQWPDTTDRTKNLPRPVFNIIELIVNNKRANVLSSKIKMVFKPVEIAKSNSEEITKKADKFTKFAEYIANDLEQDELNHEAITDGFTKGMYCYHYFWNSEKAGASSKYQGGLDGEIIDPLNIIFANPNIIDEQKQKWILIKSRESVKALKELAKKNKVPDIDLITSDYKDEDNYDIEEQDNEEYATVLTRYFRVGGEVYFEKATKSSIIQPATKLTPDTSRLTIKDGNIIEDEVGTNPDVPEKEKYKISLYPVIVGRYMKKKGCIYGQGLVEKLISQQKSINFNYAMLLLAGQNVGFPKTIVTPDALEGQEITNTPGEVLVDYDRARGGIRYLEAPTFSPVIMNLIDNIIDKTRSFNGATEVVSGEVLGANMSGSAIAALQTQAKVPIEVIQRQFWNVHRKIAKVWEQFFKTYYNDNRSFIYTSESGEKVQETFNGEEEQDIEFATNIEIGAGSLYSEAAGISFLEKLYADKVITADEYIELYPDNLVPYKNTLKKMREKKKLPEEVEQAILANPDLLNSIMNLLQGGEANGQQQVPVNMQQ